MSFIYDFAAAWNDGGTTFNGIKLNVSNGAGGAPVGAAASRIQRFQANTVDVFGVGVDGTLYTPKSITGSVLVIDPILADSGAKPFSINYNKGGIPSGGTKNNSKTVFGYNVTPEGGVADNTDVTQFVVFDTVIAFNSGSHISNFGIGADSVDGKRHTMYSMEIPHDSTQVAAFQGRMEFYTLAFQNVDGLQYASMSWDPANPKFNLSKPGAAPTQIQFNYNNSPAMLQLNAAGNATLSLPYCNSNDNLQIQQALQVAIGKLNTDNAFASFVGSVNIPDGGRVLYLSATADTAANVYSGLWGIDSTGFHSLRTQNLGGGDCVHEAWCATSGGDPWFRFNINGGGIFGIGIDNSDSDAFVLSANNGLGTNNRLRIDANTVSFPTLPIKLTPVTVASLPSAATVGSGSKKMVSDALTPAFGVAVTGGGAVVSPVYSDGTNWIVG